MLSKNQNANHNSSPLHTTVSIYLLCSPDGANCMRTGDHHVRMRPSFSFLLLNM